MIRDTPPIESLFGPLEETAPQRHQKYLAFLRWVGDEWNALAASLGLAQVRQLHEPRRAAIMARATDLVQIYEFPDALAGFKHLFDCVRRSRFLRGEVVPRDGRPPFRCTLDFMVRKSSFCKIMEGVYEDQQGGTKGQQRPYNR